MNQNELYSSLENAPSDPIFGLVEAYKADTRANKVNLTIGVLIDESGNVTTPEVVKKAMAEILADCQNKPDYLPMLGLKPYCELAAQLIFSDTYNSKRVTSAQSLGGTGALRVIADFIKNNLAKNANPEIFLSSPTWGNHKDIFATSGFKISEYAYYSAETKSFDLNACLESISQIKNTAFILLHASSHNPTGCDPKPQEWEAIIKSIKEKNLIPILDCAYQGLGEGIEEDIFPIKKLMQEEMPFFVAQSFSKSLGLYCQRTGVAHVIDSGENKQSAISSNLALSIRKMYSNPPAFGALCARKVLAEPESRKLWEAELSDHRQRLKTLRSQLVSRLSEAGIEQDLSFMQKQNGLFAYTGLNQKQAEYARNEHAVYLLNTGRICVAALNQNNLDYVVGVLASCYKIK